MPGPDVVLRRNCPWARRGPLGQRSEVLTGPRTGRSWAGQHDRLRLAGPARGPPGRLGDVGRQVNVAHTTFPVSLSVV
jgi:hypothetical protein